MKKIIGILVVVFSAIKIVAQTPQSMNYQAIARDNGGNVIPNTAIAVEFRIHDSIQTGIVVYEEDTSLTTNLFGLFTHAIGTSTPVIGHFNTIPWATNGKFLEVKVNGISMGTSQLISVPYALYADSALHAPVKIYTQGSGINISGDTIYNNAQTDATLKGNGGTTPLGIAQQSAANGQVLKWNGTTWMPANDSIGVTAINGTTNYVSKFTGTNAIGNSLIFDNGTNVGIGISTPAARLHVADSSVVFTAAGDVPATAGVPPVSGAGRRMIWYPDKAAFRVGYVSGTDWDKDSIGLYSLATGYSSKARGNSSTAMGNSIASGGISTAMGNSIASNDYSTAMGQSIASGQFSTAMGYYTTASGNYSTAMGTSTASGQSSTAMGNSEADGDFSTAIGYHPTALSFAETVLGSYNTTYTPASTTAWNAADRLFVVGNGIASNARSNAMVILKNGNIGIGISTPNAPLQFANTIVSRKIVLLEVANNDYQYYGFGINGGGLMYNAGSTGGDHIFLAGASSSASNELMRIKGNGNVSIGNIAPTHLLQLSADNAAKPSTSTWTVASDERLKTNVRDFKDGLDAIKSIHPVKYFYNGVAGMPTEEEAIGTVAQELQKVAPYMVKPWTFTDANGLKTEYLEVNYHALFFLLTNSVKELSSENDELKAKIEKLEEENSSFKTDIEKIKSQLGMGVKAEK